MEAERTTKASAPLAPPGALHEDLAELAFLLGTWIGSGEGAWPGSESFAYLEDLTIEDVGDTWLVYTERSWSPVDGSPIHFERGFLRRPEPGRVELVLAHPIGIAEVAVGAVRDGVVDLTSSAVTLTPTASPVTELRRRIEVRGDLLTYELHMAMEGIEQRSHVRSRLERS